MDSTVTQMEGSQAITALPRSGAPTQITPRARHVIVCRFTKEPETDRNSPNDLGKSLVPFDLHKTTSWTSFCTMSKQPSSTVKALQLKHPHTVPADGAVGVEVEGHQAFWTCNSKPFILVLTTVPPHTDSLGVSTKTKAGLVTEDDPLPF
ncbi:hypothetical protein NFI96_001622 [Prochilodus magdalenae]|nr:hypothetical protein NFI96_001622 [Prochilodus magdalenae]